MTGPVEPARPTRPTTLRDPWLWASMLSVIPLVARCAGGALGEPVAEDFDFLHHLLLLGRHSLLDGGGSEAFWRPVAHQLYYLALGSTIVARPGVVAALHATLLALVAALLYRTLRPVWSGPRAAAAASFPFLIESVRTVVSWPSHFVELGSLLFAVIALHEATRDRKVTSLAALLLALLCKEVAVVAAVMIPLLPRADTTRAARLRWAAATGGLAIAWGVAYLAIRQRAHLTLPHQLESDPAVLAAPPWLRLAWAGANSLRAIVSLPAVPVERQVPIGLALLAIVLAAGAVIAASGRARRRASAATPWVVWGLVWFALASATLTTIYPLWAPNRSLFGSVGFGIALVALLDAAHPALLAAMVATRLVALVIAPGAPAKFTVAPPENGAFMDFERLSRLQQLMRATRRTLRERFPTLPHGARVGYNKMPRGMEYAFGGDHGLQVWYADTTLRWVRHEDYAADTTLPLLAVVQYQLWEDPPIALIDGRAMRAMLRAIDHFEASRWEPGEAAVREAESTLTEPRALLFRGTLHALLATADERRGRHDDAYREARAGLALAVDLTEPRFLIATQALRRGDAATARGQADTLAIVAPNDTRIPALERAIEQRQ